MAGTTRKGRGQSPPGRESRNQETDKGRAGRGVGDGRLIRLPGQERRGMVSDRQGRNRGSNPTKNARKLSMLQKTIWQRLTFM